MTFEDLFDRADGHAVDAESITRVLAERRTKESDRE